MEKELFVPIKTYFEQYGYVCDGEVEDIDLYMEKGDTSIAVELKENLDFKALQQAAIRQKLTDIVYIGIFRPNNLNTKAFKDKIYLLKRLGIGLIVVSKRTYTMEIISEPIVTELSSFQIRNKGRKKILSTEFQKRKVKNNVGGVRGTKLMTSYREEALIVLSALVDLGGEATSREIKKATGLEKTTTILYKNYYGWFERVGTGKYKAHENGYAALEEFEETIAALHKIK